MLLFLWSGQIAMSQQPYAPCWHPLNLKGWNPSMDPDFQFNKIATPFSKHKFECKSLPTLRGSIMRYDNYE